MRTIVPHPLVKPTQHLMYHDLVLVRLQDPLVLGLDVDSVCVAEEKMQEEPICVVAGWSSSKDGGSYRQYVSRLDEPLVDSQACNSSTLYGGHLGQSMLCIRSQSGSLPCHDDSPGAPLMCLRAGSWRLQGVLSFSGGCGGADRPHVFTDMVKHRGWVLDTMGGSISHLILTSPVPLLTSSVCRTKEVRCPSMAVATTGHSAIKRWALNWSERRTG